MQRTEEKNTGRQAERERESKVEPEARQWWQEGGEEQITGLHEVGAVWSPVRPILGPELQGLVPELRAEGVLEATQHHHHALKDLPHLLRASSGCLVLLAFSSGLPWHCPPCWGRD